MMKHNTKIMFINQQHVLFPAKEPLETGTIIDPNRKCLLKRGRRFYCSSSKTVIAEEETNDKTLQCLQRGLLVISIVYREDVR